MSADPPTTLNAIPNSLPLSRVWPYAHHVVTLRKWMERWRLSTEFHEGEKEAMWSRVAVLTVTYGTFESVLYCLNLQNETESV